MTASLKMPQRETLPLLTLEALCVASSLFCNAPGPTVGSIVCITVIRAPILDCNKEQIRLVRCEARYSAVPL